MALSSTGLVVHSRDLADPACMPPDCFNGPRRVGVAAKPQAVHNRTLNQSSICLYTCPSVCWGMFRVFYEKKYKGRGTYKADRARNTAVHHDRLQVHMRATQRFTMLVWAASRGGTGSLAIGAVHPAHCGCFIVLLCML